MKKLIDYCAHEPIVHFLIFGLVLLGGYLAYRSHILQRIEIDQAAIDSLVLGTDKEKRLTGLDADAAGIVRKTVEDEILYREALKRGMTESLPVRELMIQMLRRELEPVVPEPTDDQLRALRKESAGSYRFPPRISFEHVSYPGNFSQVPSDLLDRLNNGEDPKLFGRRIQLANPLPLTYKPHLDNVLGKGASDFLFRFKPGQWYGPVKSLRGIHFVRILSKSGAKDMPFAQVRETLKSNWEREQKLKAVNAAVRRMASAYRIIVPKAYEGALP